jgi:DNA polymerase-3 subunit delta
MATHLFHGADPVLLSSAVSEKVRELIGDGDRSLMLDEFVDDYVMGSVIESASTPPFFTDRRVVVVHQGETTTADDVEALSAYIREEAEFTDLVVVWHKGKILKALADAVKAAGGRNIDVMPPTRAADRRSWWEEQVAVAGLNLDAKAMSLLVEWLGEDVGRFDGVARTLASTYGAAVITADKLEPFLGERGDVKPWDLTDAIDGGNATKALMVARRMMTAGERHPLQIMAQLHSHFARLAKLDGPSVQSVGDAEALTGAKGFQAEKALKAYRNLGSSGLRRAFDLLATADLDLRGRTGLDNDVVMDVLVARLAKLAAPAGRRR